MNLPPALRPSRLSPRARYVTGGLVGALMATSLVMLGTVLPYGGHGDKQHVTLTGSEGEVADAPAVETTAATGATETTGAPIPAAPTASEVPGRVVAVEDRVGKVESRVDKLETTTTTIPDCQGGFWELRPGGGGFCNMRDTTLVDEDAYKISTTSTTVPAPTTTTVHPQPVWTTDLADGQVTVTLQAPPAEALVSPRGVTTLTLDDGTHPDVAFKYDGTLKAGQTATWVWQAGNVMMHSNLPQSHWASGTITGTADAGDAPWWNCDDACQPRPADLNWVLVNPTVS